MKDFLKEIEKRILIYDGSKGYMLQRLGLKGGECGELWNVNKRDAVMEVHRLYKEAGSDVIQTNTFTGSRVHLEKYALEDRTYELNYEGAKLAREVAGDDIFVAASIGPTGLMFEPYGELTFEKAYEIYKEQIKAVVDGGVDIINFETFTDLAEVRAALLAAKENSRLPVICSMAFEANGHTLMGSEPYVVVRTLLSLGADMVGANCSFGAEHMEKIVEGMYEAGGGRLSVKPNAGMPEMIGDKVCYKQSAQDFARLVSRYVKYGAGLIGGCCGTTPEFINTVKKELNGIMPEPYKKIENSIIASSTRYLPVSSLNICKVGRLEAELDGKDYSDIESIAQDISDEGYDTVMVSLKSNASEKNALSKAVGIAQTYIKSPLLIKAWELDELDKALRIYNGVAGIIPAKQESDYRVQLDQIADKYGSVVVNSVS